MRDEQTDTPWAAWQGRIAASRKRRDQWVGEWQENVRLRKGDRVAASTVSTLLPLTARPTVSINQDWPLTKAKIAQLYSQTPEVRLTPTDEQFRPAVPIFAKELNHTIEHASVGTTIEEVLADVVNAAGIGGVLVSCETRTEPRDVPSVDPALIPPDVDPATLPMTTVQAVTDVAYLVTRISPTDLLVPTDFVGSQYDHARWLGHDGRMTWAQAVASLGLTDEHKDDVLGKDKRASGSTNTLNTDTASFRDTDVVQYTQIFAWRHFDDAAETKFQALQRLVFVDGLEEPVINEPYTGQRRTPDGRLVGVLRNPIRVLTLTYISDDGLPPSDSSIGRGAVDELQQSRESMTLQRKHSIPFRWGDTNRISATQRAKIDRGEFQGFIWTNGPGDRAIGEVARAQFPAERWEFDDKIKSDLTEIWQVGTNQAGAFASGERSAREAGIIQSNFQRRVGQEQDKVTRFFVGIAEVLAGHLALYGTFDLPDHLGQQRELLANAFTYSVRADSTVRLDAEQRIEQLLKGLNITAQSGYVNPKPIISEIWELLGVDPEKVMIDPQPKPPEPVKVSVSKAEDLRDVLFLATLMRTQQAPTPDDVQAAIRLQAVALVGAPIPPSIPSEADPNQPPREPKTPDNANTEWETSPRVERRAKDFGA